MQLLMSLYTALLFFVLVPGVLVSLPPKSGKLTVALTHAVVFTLVFQLTHKAVANLLSPFENFENHEMCSATMPCAGGKKCTNGVCA
jgi:hypothetical protein